MKFINWVRQMNDNARLRRRRLGSHPYEQNYEKGDFKYILWDFIKCIPFIILFLIFMFVFIPRLI
jgi:hypothetical protein